MQRSGSDSSSKSSSESKAVNEGISQPNNKSFLPNQPILQTESLKVAKRSHAWTSEPPALATSLQLPQLNSALPGNSLDSATADPLHSLLASLASKMDTLDLNQRNNQQQTQEQISHLQQKLNHIKSKLGGT